MSWFRLDDQGAFHAKVLAAGNEAYGAWCRAGQWSSLHGENGAIPRATALTIARQKVWERLVSVGLCESLGDDGWLIHDFLDYNPLAEKVRAKREARAEAGRRGGRRSGESRAKQSSTNDEANAKQTDNSNEANVKQNSTPIPIPIPIPEEKEDPLVVPVDGPSRPEGVSLNLWRMHGEAYFVAVYERAVREASGNPQWALRSPEVLRRVLAKSCLGDSRGDIEGWIDRNARELVAFVRGLDVKEKTYWNDFGPAEMQRWFNRPERGLKPAADRPTDRDSKPRLKPPSAPDEAIPTMTPDEAAAWQARIAEAFSAPPKARIASAPDDPLSADEIREAEERRQAGRARRGAA